MSYDMWQNNYAGDPSVVGSTFWINTKAVTITGIAPKGFYGDRLSSAPPDFYLPIESMPVLANSTFVHEPAKRWLYIIGRVKPGVAIAPLQAKVSELVRQSFATTTTFSDAEGNRALARAKVVLSSGGAGIQDMQDSYASNTTVRPTRRSAPREPDRLLITCFPHGRFSLAFTWRSEGGEPPPYPHHSSAT
jgi:macrolide transport system ATP-binding/permease protein